jgi:signal transduction histidine kinase
MSSMPGAERIRVTAAEDIPAVNADANRLERIMMNLLTNALKYSKAGTEIQVVLAHRAGEVTTTVRDEGPGIDPKDLPRLFDRFYRTESARRCEGLGLGLYITKGLVDAHGGRLWVESALDNGSAFSFTLPVAH